MSPTQQAAEQAARASYGRLLAWLARRSRDLAAAEDALSEAFRAALETWPARGIPTSPEAWLLTAARRNLGHAQRHQGVRAAAAAAMAWLAEEAEDAPADIPDQRLGLLFACADPGIAEADRAPLMLQAVLGLDAARIAGAFLASPAAMAQRLVRAKSRLREAGLRFEIPGRDAMPARLQAVLEAIYAAYGSGWEDIAGADPRRRGLAEEALFLARLLAALLPEEPEALGLSALLCHCEARRPARRGPGGGFIPLAEQEVALWERALQAEAEAALHAAFALHRPGRFQLEAAIQSAHASRAVLGSTPWAGIRRLYDALAQLAPTAGALVGQAAATAEAEGAAAGLALLEALPPALAAAYQPYHALRAHLLARLGQDASASFRQAIGLAEDPAVRAFLTARMGEAGASADAQASASADGPAGASADGPAGASADGQAGASADGQAGASADGQAGARAEG